MSNFLLWQGAYTELVFFKKTWPDFTKEDFLKQSQSLKVEREDLAGINFLYKNNAFVKRFLSSIILMFSALYLNYLGGVYFLLAVYIVLIILLAELHKLFDIKFIIYIFF